MLSPIVPHNGSAPEPPASTLDTRKLRLYVLLIVVIPFAFLLSAIPIVLSATFPGESGDPFLLNLEYPFSFSHADCQVVVFGDSTATTGIDPTTIQTATGLKTCSIAQSQSILEILGPLALDEYLKNNTPPEYLVMQFAPETLAWDRTNVFWPEGLTLLLRKKPLPQGLAVLAAHPVEAYNFALWALKAKFAALSNSTPDFRSTEAIFHSRQGLLILPKPPETRCTTNNRYLPPKLSWIRMLREKYSKSGTRVIIDVSPVPVCTAEAARMAADTANLTDNALPLYPIDLFCDLDRHLTLRGAEQSSMQIAAQILSSGEGLNRRGTLHH
jgi:hypothetical protein